MPDSLVAALLVMAWVVAGVLVAIFMHSRRGRSSGWWWVISIIFGPFSLFLTGDRSEERTTSVVERASGDAQPGAVVLAAVDGSSESTSAVDAALELLGPQVGTLVLLHVLDYDEAQIDGEAARIRAHELVETVAARVPVGFPLAVTEVAIGRPADALLECAARESADVIIVGHRGHGLSRAVIGSVCDEVVRRSPIPVLVGGGPRIGDS